MYISLPLQKTDESSTIQHGVKVSASASAYVCVRLGACTLVFSLIPQGAEQCLCK